MTNPVTGRAAVSSESEGARLAEIFGRIRQTWQPFKTVWGVKSMAGQLTWELYFYDYDRAERRCGIAALQEFSMHLRAARV